MHAMIRRAAMFASILAMLATTAAAEPVHKPLRDDDIVARVNGTPIYRRSVRDVVQGILTLQDAPPDNATIGKLADDALDSLIALELLYQESQARGINVADAAVDEEIGRSRSQFPNARAFEAAMKAKGMTEADLRRDTRKTMAVNRLLEGGVWKELRITPEQVKDFYEHHHDEFKHPAEVRASHILIHVPDGASAADRNAAQQRAAALLDKLKAGADFAQLAREVSDDPSSKMLGGDLGYIGADDMPEAFAKQAFSLAPGQISNIVSTPYGFHIIKVTDKRGAGYLPLEEVQDRISAVLLKDQRQQRQAELVAELRKRAKVDLLDAAR